MSLSGDSALTEIELCALPGARLLTPKIFSDTRGAVWETYHRGRYAEYSITDDFVQDNHSLSRRGVIRGLHFQAEPLGQAKLIRCNAGKVFDVAVDIRPDSAAFGRVITCELSADNRRQLYLPRGIAHGFACLTDTAEVEYKCSAPYVRESQRVIRWNDPELDIPWPFDKPIISEQDQEGMAFADFRDTL
jgi:dTDP-4-dehydrorhamnose 3,5-epimerase